MFRKFFSKCRRIFRNGLTSFANKETRVGVSTGKSFVCSKWADDFYYDLGYRVESTPRLLADVTGDGKADVVAFANKETRVGVSTGKSFVCSKWADDFYYNLGYRVESTPRLLADITGDGKADIVAFANKETRVGISTGNGFTCSKWADDFYYNLGYRVETTPRLLADITGDGKADIVAFANYETRAGIADNDRFTCSKWNEDLCYYKNWRINNTSRMLGYVDSDKMSDIVAINSSGEIIIYLSNKKTFVKQ